MDCLVAITIIALTNNTEVLAKTMAHENATHINQDPKSLVRHLKWHECMLWDARVEVSRWKYTNENGISLDLHIVKHAILLSPICPLAYVECPKTLSSSRPQVQRLRCSHQWKARIQEDRRFLGGPILAQDSFLVDVIVTLCRHFEFQFPPIFRTKRLN